MNLHSSNDGSLRMTGGCSSRWRATSAVAAWCFAFAFAPAIPGAAEDARVEASCDSAGAVAIAVHGRFFTRSGPMEPLMIPAGLDDSRPWEVGFGIGDAGAILTLTLDEPAQRQGPRAEPTPPQVARTASPRVLHLHEQRLDGASVTRALADVDVDGLLAFDAAGPHVAYVASRVPRALVDGRVGAYLAVSHDAGQTFETFELRNLLAPAVLEADIEMRADVDCEGRVRVLVTASLEDCRSNAVLSLIEYRLEGRRLARSHIRSRFLRSYPEIVFAPGGGIYVDGVSLASPRGPRWVTPRISDPWSASIATRGALVYTTRIEPTEPTGRPTEPAAPGGSRSRLYRLTGVRLGSSRVLDAPLERLIGVEGEGVVWGWSFSQRLARAVNGHVTCFENDGREAACVR